MSDPTQPPVDDLDLEMPGDLDVRECYRHPGRETGVSCSNCGRPICHECMIPAAVGFRCPDCVAEQRRGQPRLKIVTRDQTRSRWLSGLAGSRGFSVTKVLVVINAVIFLVEAVYGQSQGLGLNSAFFPGLPTRVLVDLGALYTPLVAVKHEYWRLFTSLFLHANLFHIAFNMWALYVVGEYLEASVGRLRFALVYFISGLAGSVLVLLLAPLTSVTVGASGAVFGTFAALLVYAYVNRYRHPLAGALLRNLGFLIVINLLFTFGARGAISWQAHIGGLLAGAAVMGVMTTAGRKDPGGRFGVAEAGALAAIVAVLVLAALFRAQSLVALLTLPPWR